MERRRPELRCRHPGGRSQKWHLKILRECGIAFVFFKIRVVGVLVETVMSYVVVAVGGISVI
jgi:hypothetical protein